MRIYFCSIPFIDSSYNNVLSYGTQDNFISFMKSKTQFTMEINTKGDSLKDTLTIRKNINELLNIDYLYYEYSIGGDLKRYCYFIEGKEYTTESTTTLHLSLDIWNTYYFNYNLLESFVDRMHVPRWVNNYPTEHLLDDELQSGELEQFGSPETIAVFNDAVVLASTVPLGKVPNVNPGGGGTPGGSGNCWEEGKPSAKGFRFQKGFEGYAPYEYQDSGGYWTIGYGTTKHGEPDIYASLVAQQPVPEDVAAKVGYDLMTKNYGLKILDSVKNLGCNKQSQFDALLSVAYNSGNGSITGDNKLTNVISLDPNNETAIRPVWESFKVTSGGQLLPGLVARRKQECNLYFDQDTELRPIGILNSSGSITGTVTDNDGNGWLPDD